MDHDAQRLAARLEAERPRLDPDTSSRVRRDLVQARQARRTPPILITLMLTLGMVASLGGTGLAITGFSSSPKAVDAQYQPGVTGGAPSLQGEEPAGGGQGAEENAPSSGGGALPSDEGEIQDDGAGGVGNEAETGPGVGAGDTGEGDTVTRARESAAVLDDGELPFTGWAALPIMLLGVALLVSGVVLRRRTAAPHAAA